MLQDPIVEEIYRMREEYAKRLGYDLLQVCEEMASVKHRQAAKPSPVCRVNHSSSHKSRKAARVYARIGSTQGKKHPIPRHDRARQSCHPQSCPTHTH